MHRLSKRKIVASLWDLPDDYSVNPKHTLAQRRYIKRANRRLLASYLTYVWDDHYYTFFGKTRRHRNRKLRIYRSFIKHLVPCLFREADKIIGLSHDGGFLFSDLELELEKARKASDRNNVNEVITALINFSDIIIHEIPSCPDDPANDVILKMRKLAFILKDTALFQCDLPNQFAMMEQFYKDGYFQLSYVCTDLDLAPSGYYLVRI